MADYITDTWSLMQAVKQNLKDYRKYTGVLRLSRGEINFGLGFILPKTVFPAITVFPMSKTFGLRRSGGRSIIEYRLSVDIYSPRKKNIEDAKDWVLDAVEDVKKCLIGSNMIMAGKKHCFDTAITGINIAEQASGSSGNTFQSIGSVQVSCSAYHYMAADRNSDFGQAEIGTKAFQNKVLHLVKANTPNSHKVKDWIGKVAKTTLTNKTPVCMVLPGDEWVQEEEYAGRTDLLVRPIYFNVISNAFPKVDMVRENIALADNIVTGVERAYRVGGYARNAVIRSITYDWGGQAKDFRFFSNVETQYECVQTATRVLR